APGPITATNTVVEPDLSNAGPYLAAAVVTGGRVTVPFWPIETTQIGDRWRTILPKFGAEVSFERVEGTDYGNLTVTGVLDNDGQPVVTAAGELSDWAELTPTTATLALLADGPTRLTTLGRRRGHDTARLSAFHTEGGKRAGSCPGCGGFLDFPGNCPLRAAPLDSYADLRMATFGAILGPRVDGIVVTDIAAAAK